MESPPDVRFRKDLHLIAWRPRGLLDEAAVNSVLVDLLRREAAVGKPFNRFSDLFAGRVFPPQLHICFSCRFLPAPFLSRPRAGKVRVLYYASASCPHR